MATSSLALPPNPAGGDDEPIPAMLDRARGLAASIHAAVTAGTNTGGTPITLELDASPIDAAAMADSSLRGPAGPARAPVSRLDAMARLTQTQGGRITKTRQARHRPSPVTHPSDSSTASSSSSASLLSADLTPNPATASVTTASAASSSSPPAPGPPPPPLHRRSQQLPQKHQHQHQHHHHRRSVDTMPAMDPPVLSFWGPDPVPLPSRFARIKRSLITGHESALEASWTRLIVALRAEVEHIEGLGAHLIPSIEFADVEDVNQTRRFGRDLRKYGVGVVRKVVPKKDADDMVSDTVRYLEGRNTNNKNNKSIRPPPQDPTCFDYFWTPAQVRSRAHPSVLRAQRFMMGLWETTPDDRLATRLPITYVDRIRIHGAPSANASSGSSGLNLPVPIAAPDAQSADDWITALQSSAGIIAQVDNGSLERWEPDGYQRGGTYTPVFHGRWEDHDPWQCASRVPATMDLYNGYGACTIFRMFQGVLALSTIEPGMIRLLPSPKLATAYYLLRPFFNPVRPAPEVRSGPEWDAYLAPENWKLQREPDTIIHGAVPGHAQRITEHWHPHLHLRSSMITLPTLQPGDYILWHPDLPYHISSNNSGLKTPSSQDATSILVYIPAAPLTQTAALYLARQRKAFQRGHPGPDFDSTGRGSVVEDPDVRPGEKVIAEVGGPAGLQAMGLAPWEASATRAGTPPPGQALDERPLSTNSSSNSSNSSGAEAEVVRLSNIILFPDRSMMGYSV